MSCKKKQLSSDRKLQSKKFKTIYKVSVVRFFQGRMRKKGVRLIKKNKKRLN